MASTPYCNVTVARPPGDPNQSSGFQRVPSNATPDQMANIINNNFALLTKGNFAEDRSKRVVQVVDVTDPANPGSSVRVEVVNAVTFRNSTTGQTVVWKR